LRWFQISEATASEMALGLSILIALGNSKRSRGEPASSLLIDHSQNEAEKLLFDGSRSLRPVRNAPIRTVSGEADAALTGHGPTVLNSNPKTNASNAPRQEGKPVLVG
jgi:hypothetical protein